MNEERELLSFAQQLNSEVFDRASADSSADFKENVFTEIVVEYLSEIGMVENAEICHYLGGAGSGSMQVNGYAVNEEEDRVDIFVTLFSDSSEPTKISNEDVAKAGRRAFRFFQASIKGLHNDLEPALEAYGMVSRIHELKGKLKEVRIFILMDGIIRAKKIADAEVQGIKVHFEAWDLERLFRGIRAGLPRDEINIDFMDLHGSSIPCLPMPTPARDYDVYLVILPGEVLYRMYEEYGSRLLELNVRSFLQARGKVNRGIRDTLRNEPDRFMAYNNGISATAESLDVQYLKDGRVSIKSIKGLQIVNGGQTTASIHRAKKQEKIDLTDVYVFTKITVIEDNNLLEDIVPRISQYANTQNVIQLADFSANEPYHIEIERLSGNVWCPGERERWFYERARGQYQVAKSKCNTPARLRNFNEETPPSRKFTKTDLAKYINCWEKLPHVVSKGGQKNFVTFMEGLRKSKIKDWLPDDVYYKELIAKAILFKSVQKIVRDNNFPGYRANIVAYLISYLSYRSGSKLDLDRIWSIQDLSKELNELLSVWSFDIYANIISSANGRNVTEWCKKEDCWRNIQNLNLSLPDDLPPEMQAHTIRKTKIKKEVENITSQDYENIAICRQLDEGTWLYIHSWGKKSGRLSDEMCDLALKFVGKASSGWDGEITKEEAILGIEILSRAKDAGIDLTKKSETGGNPDLVNIAD